MTVSLNLANIANAISALSVSGVTVKDKDELSGSWVSIPNVLYPNPDEWITNFSIKLASVLQGASAPMDISYTLNYRFLGVLVGDIGMFTTAYSALVDKVVLIINAFIALDAPYSGRVQLAVTSVNLGPKSDPAGNNYFGADIAVNVMEMQN